MKTLKNILILFFFFPALVYAHSGEIYTDGRTTEGYIIQNQGTTISFAPYLNFTGAGVTATSDSVKTYVTISATGSGGAGDTFKTWTVPNGTNPVADSTTDTVTFTEANGIVITGTAGTDTIDFGLSLTGDVTIDTVGSVGVSDDSHNHVVGNIDSNTSANWAAQISDEDGTGECGANLFCMGGHTHTGAGGQIDKTFEHPANGDIFYIWKPQSAVTITDIEAIVDPADSGESVVLDCEECDGDGDNCVNIDADITVGNTTTSDDGALSNGGIDADDWVRCQIGTVTGTVTQITVRMKY